MSDLEAHVPQETDEPLQGRGKSRIGGSWQQHEEIDVGIRIELAAPVAAYRHERGVAWHATARPDVA
jgi:hypothetical protein